MIRSTDYDFVNVQPGFIHNNGSGFSSASPIPTFEDAAYMREIYRTVMCRAGYAVERYRDVYNTDAGSKDDVKMIPGTMWQRDAVSIASVMTENGLKFSGTRSSVLASYRINAYASYDPTYIPSSDGLLDSDILALGQSASSSISAPGEKSWASRDFFYTYLAAARSLKSRSPDWPWFYRLYNNTGGRFTSTVGFDSYYYETSSQWKKNGSQTTETPRSFVTDYLSSYRPKTFAKRSDSEGTTIWSLEGSWYYRYLAPPWTHGRTTDGTQYHVPVWRILVQRLWDVTNTSTGTVYKGVGDAKVWDIYWNGAVDDISLSVPTNGGNATIELSVNYSSTSSIEDLGNKIITSSGAVSIAQPTIPGGSLPTYHTETVSGYDIDISLAGVIMTRRGVVRDLNP